MTQKTRNGKIFSTFNLTRMALLAAMASILFLIEIPIVAFYKLDLSNIPVLLGAFSMGAVPGVVILAIKSAIGILHSSSAGVGELADFVMGAALIVPAAMHYHRNKTRKNAIAGMVIGTVCMVVAGVLMNKWVMLPFYMGAFHMTMEELIQAAHWGGVDSEWKLLLLITAPFNLIKGLVISIPTAVLYKRVSPILHGKS